MTDYYAHIEDYITGKLSQPDLELFQKEMDQNINLKNAVDNHDIVDQALDILIEDDIKGVIGDIGAQTSEQNTPTPNGMKSLLTFMIVSLLLGAMAYLYNSMSKPKHEMLFAEYYTEYIGGDVRGENQKWKELSRCEQGHLLIQKKEYLAAKKILVPNTMIVDNCTDKSEWYLALIYLQEGNTTAAYQLLEKVNYDVNSVYRGKAFELLEEMK